MRLKIVRPFGFCLGVKRAIRIVEDTLKKKGNYYSLGPVIHNPYVIEKLSKRGLNLIKDINLLPKPSLLFLPTHGTPLKLIKRLKKKNIDFIDLICPYVAKLQRICKNLKDKGFKVIIVGDKKHPEIRALTDIDRDAIVIDPGLCCKAGVDRKEDLLDNKFLEESKKLGIISQTTQSKEKYLQIVSNLIKKYPKIKEFYIFNTICPDSLIRQERVKELAKKVDLMLVIGGKESANTKRLYRIAKRTRKNSYHIEDEKEINRLSILKDISIGIASGASTPEVLARKIVRRLRERWKKI